jgi:predicted signal transduction protein with EAL and GGDEF domain
VPMREGMRSSGGSRHTWRGWDASDVEGSRPVTSSRLPAAAPVASRVFPKTRSWIALGAPLELLSPLSVLRIIYALAAVLWTVELVTLPWSADAFGWLIGAVVTAVTVWTGMLFTKTLSPDWCRLLIAVASALVVTLVYLGRSTGPVLVSALFLLPLALFVALYLGSRAVVVYQLLAAGGLWLALARDLGVGAAAVVAVAGTVTILSASLTVQVLVRSVWRSGAADPDTGLPNGAGLAHRISTPRASGGSHRAFVVAAVFLAGVDDARQALGYQVGTELLRRAIEDLGQVVPADAVISRVEGDELVVTRGLGPDLVVAEPGSPLHDIPEGVLAEGIMLARNLASTIGSGRYLVDGVELSLRAHVGLVFAPWDGTEVAELVRRASLSARRAAASGTVHAVWDGDRGTLTGEDLALLADLRFAAERHELRLVYQPQISVLSGGIVSVEALLRWQSPVHGNVPPGRFIVLAERTGLIDRLTQWVLGEALDAQVRWRRALVDLPVAVNLSAKTLRLPDLSEWIMSELATRQLPPSALTVEVT